MSMPEPQESIAIVGMAGRFPQARNLEEFWRNLREGRECISFFKDEPVQRLRIASADAPDGPYGKPSNVIQNNDSPEGPVCYRLGSQTIIFFNTYTRSGAVRSSDMEHWEDISAGVVLRF